MGKNVLEATKVENDERKSKRKVLVEFMKYKAALLGEKYKNKFFTKEDEKELSKIKLDRAEKIFNKLDLRISTNIELDDANICPYCHDVKGDDCQKCLYAKRHGACDEVGSTYNEIAKTYGGNIIDAIGENLLKRIWNMLKIKYKLSGGTVYKPFFTIKMVRNALKRFTIVLNTMVKRNDYKAVDLLNNTNDADISLIFTKLQRNLILALDNLLVSGCNEIRFKEIYPYCILRRSVLFVSCEGCKYKNKCVKEDKFDVDIIVQLWESILFDVHNLYVGG